MKLDVVIQQNFTSISDDYRQFAKEKDACRSCSLYEHYKHVGQSEGNAANPTFMIIGESLGQKETEEGRPFVGKAGQYLRAELRKHSAVFSRKTTLITNVLPCRPQDNSFPKDSNGPHWRVSKGYKFPCKARQLVELCSSAWLNREISIVRPKVIITLGSQSLDCVRGDRGITANRGAWKFIDKFKIWSLATYHPSYVIRCANDKSKENVPYEFSLDIEKAAKEWRSLVG